jgi:hypothetical protein
MHSTAAPHESASGAFETYRPALKLSAYWGMTGSNRRTVKMTRLTRNGHLQRDRFRSQRRTHRISRFYWQRRYGIFSLVPNSYRTWIKASAVLPTPPESPSRSNRFPR